VKSKNSAGGIDGLSVEAFEGALKKNLEELRKDLIEKKWNPEPYLRVEIEKKGSGEKRKLGLLSVRDKIVQQAIKSLVEPRLEKIFIKNSYGYRPGRGPVKAIVRTQHIFEYFKKGWVAKLDINNFFDGIQHDRLFQRLNNLLIDEELVRLIELSVKTGVVSSKMKWDEMEKGVPQGAVLSPLLANFYLHPFDQFVVSKTSNYVRYADDFVLVARTKQELEYLIHITEAELKKNFHLTLHPPVIAHLEEGVEFLGITVRSSGLTLSEKKKNDLLERIGALELDTVTLSEKGVETLQGIKNYYGRLLPQSFLKELDCRLIRQIHEEIERKKDLIPNKTRLSAGLKTLFFLSDDMELSKPVLIQDFVNTYLEVTKKKVTKPKKTNNKDLINLRKREYRKREREGSELVVTTPGSFIGKTNYGIQVKVRGEVVYRKPTHALKHITVTGQGVSLSSSAIRYCVNQKITVAFFDEKGKHYASLLSPVSMDGMLWQQQASLPLEKKMELGRRIMISKLKNQMSLIKYFHKYHKTKEDLVAEKYPEIMLRMEGCLSRIKTYKEIDPDYATYFMGQEAAASNAYWDFVRILIHDDGIEFYRREHQGAKDLFNSMLNYGYAILYARIWNALLQQKLNPSLPVLHAYQAGKPAFSYDVIELFRSQAVDRVVISLIQKSEPLKMHDGLLTEPTKRLLIENILERLNRYEKYRSEDRQLDDIIHLQAKEIAAFISGESKTYKPYLAKW